MSLNQNRFGDNNSSRRSACGHSPRPCGGLNNNEARSGYQNRFGDNNSSRRSACGHSPRPCGGLNNNEARSGYQNRFGDNNSSRRSACGHSPRPCGGLNNNEARSGYQNRFGDNNSSRRSACGHSPRPCGGLNINEARSGYQNRLPVNYDNNNSRRGACDNSLLCGGLSNNETKFGFQNPLPVSYGKRNNHKKCNCGHSSSQHLSINERNYESKSELESLIDLGVQVSCSRSVGTSRYQIRNVHFEDHNDHVDDKKGSKEVESTDKITMDLTSRVIGDFGKWQLYICIMMTLLKLPIAWYQLNIIFMAPPQEFWCAKPEKIKYSVEEWRKMCSPRLQEHPCLIYDPDMLALAPEMDTKYIPLVPCTKFVYDNSTYKHTITGDWDLVCSRHWLVHLSQCIMMWGILVGGIIFGVLADKYGRKTYLMVSILIQAVFSLLIGFLKNFWLFLCFWFILAIASGGVGIISFVICMEVVGGKYRTTLPVLYQLPFGLGTAAMAGLAYWLRDWRHLEIALGTISATFILYWFFLPESPRWLLATGQTEKALEVLKSAAKFNNMEFDEDEVREMLPENVEKRKDPGFKSFFTSKKMRLRTTLLSINWFCTGLAFYTFSQYLGSIGRNIFTAVALTGIISTLGGIFCMFIITKLGRKTTVGVFQFMTGLCFVMILRTPRDSKDLMRLLYAGIGFAGMAGSIPALYLFTGELFPTMGRNVGISGVTMFARIASMAAPAVVYLDTLFENLALIVLSIMLFAQILLLLPLPETKDRPLLNTLEEIEQM